MTHPRLDGSRDLRRPRSLVTGAAALVVLTVVGILGGYGYQAGWFGARAGRDGSFHGTIGQVVLDAGPGTWPAMTELHVDPGGPAQRIADVRGLVGARTLYRLSASSEPARPVRLRIARPTGFAEDRSIISLSTRAGVWSPLPAVSSTGTIELLVPHFSDILLFSFKTAAAAADAAVDQLIADAATWLQGRLGMDTCRPRSTSRKLLMDYVRDSTQLAVWAEDDATGVAVHICNRRSYYVEYKVSGLQTEDDLVAPHAEVTIHLPARAVAGPAGLSVSGSYTSSAMSADVQSTALALIPYVGWTQTDLTLRDVEDLNQAIALSEQMCLPADLDEVRAGPQTIVGCLVTHPIEVEEATIVTTVDFLRRIWGALVDLDPVRLLLDKAWEKAIERVIGGSLGKVASPFVDFVVGLAEQLWDASLHNDVSHVDLVTAAAVARSLVVTSDVPLEGGPIRVRWSDLQGRERSSADLPPGVVPTEVAGGRLLGVRGGQVVTIGRDGAVTALTGAPGLRPGSTDAVAYDPSGSMWMWTRDTPTSTSCETSGAGLGGATASARTLLDRTDGGLTQARWSGTGPVVTFVQAGCGPGGFDQTTYLGWTVDLADDEMRPLPVECALMSAAGADWTLACGSSPDRVDHAGPEGQLTLYAPSGQRRVIPLGQRDALKGVFDQTAAELAVEVVEDRQSDLHGQDPHYTMLVDVASGTIRRLGPDQMVPEQWLPDGRLIGSYAPMTGELRFGTYVVAPDGTSVEIGSGQEFLGVAQP